MSPIFFHTFTELLGWTTFYQSLKNKSEVWYYGKYKCFVNNASAKSCSQLYEFVLLLLERKFSQTHDWKCGCQCSSDDHYLLRTFQIRSSFGISVTSRECCFFFDVILTRNLAKNILDGRLQEFLQFFQSYMTFVNVEDIYHLRDVRLPI